MPGCLRLLAFLLVPAFAQEPETLTLDRAIDLALEHNRLILNSTLEVKKFEDRLAATRTRRLPAFSWYVLGAQLLNRLDFTIPRGALGVYPQVGPIPGKDSSITTPQHPAAFMIGRVAQPISQLYKIGLGLKQVGLGRDLAVEQRRAERQKILNEVKRTWFGMLQTQSALEAVEESIRLYKELDRLTGEYVAQQAALKGDLLDIKTRVARAEYDALRLRNPLATQQEYLNSLLGRPIETRFRPGPVEEAAWSEIDLDGARRKALEQRPELREARLKLKQAEFDVRTKKADYLPNVSASFDYLSARNYGSLIPANIASVGLVMDWQPFDWGRRRHEVAEKTKTVEQAKLALAETEASIAIDVNSRYRKLEETRAQLTVAHLSQETARERLRVTKNRYEQQASLLKDVLQQQTELAAAGQQYQQALAEFWTARADFEKTLGEER